VEVNVILIRRFWLSIAACAVLLACNPLLAQTAEQQKRLDKLDAACEKERAKSIKDVEQRRINQCAKGTSKSPEECKQYWSNYGKDKGKGGDRSEQPELYSNLPQCKKAAQERAKFKPH
jgi:hypothetical protein